MPVFSEQDLAFFREQGYVIAKNAAPPEDLAALRGMLDELVGLHPDTWYKPPHHPGAFVEAYHQQALWNTRQRPRVIEAFRQLLQSDIVYVGVDRVSVKLPMHPDHQGFGGALPMHWDIKVKAGADHQWQGLQGVLAITDTDETMGGFACVPGSHLRINEILAARPDFEFFAPSPSPDIAGRAIPMNAGDLLIWTPNLLHGSLENTSTRPRLAQYIKFSRGVPLTPEERRQNAERLASLAPMAGWKEHPQVQQPREWACRPREAPVLSGLGRKVAGLDPW